MYIALFVLVAAWLAHAQLQTYTYQDNPRPSTIVMTPTDPFFSEDDLEADAKCGVGLQHVVALMAITPGLPNGQNGSEYTTQLDLGCCPAGHYGCWDQNDNRLLNCCEPIDGLQPVCCFNEAGASVGCARSTTQCCGKSVCPDGYVCCGTTCCPLIGGDYNQLNQSCLIQATNTSDGVLVYQAVDCIAPPPVICNTTTSFTVACNGPGFNLCPFCEPPQILCTWPNASNVFPKRCNLLADCAFRSYPWRRCTGDNMTGWALIPCTENVTQMVIPAGCKQSLNPGNTCMYGGQEQGQGAPYVVGQLRTGQSCCGPYICSAGMQCCSQTNLTNSTINGTMVEQTTYYGCCPVRSSPNPIRCCYNNVIDSADDTRPQGNFFCGASYGTQTCMVDKLREYAWFAVALRNLNGTNL